MTEQCRRRFGFTLVELLLAVTILVLVLGATLSIFVSSLRAQRVIEAQSLRIQEAEVAIHLINYEVGLAGYTRTREPESFGPSESTIVVLLGGPGVSDRVRIRYFEDADFLADTDSGERWVEYRVDSTRGALVRHDLLTGQTEELVGGVRAFDVVAFIGRERQPLTNEEVQGGTIEIAGVRVAVAFEDLSEWAFLIGLYNRQQVTVQPPSG